MRLAKIRIFVVAVLAASFSSAEAAPMPVDAGLVSPADAGLCVLLEALESAGADLSRIPAPTGGCPPWAASDAAADDLLGPGVIEGLLDCVLFARCDSEPPRVVTAGSTGNTSVVVQFNKPMADSAADPANYSIVQQKNPEATRLVVNAAEFTNEDRNTVRLTTGSQAALTYELAAFNMTDRNGNSFPPPTVTVGGRYDPSRTTFSGTAPTGDEIVDTDGDGTSDDVEQRGWTVVVLRADDRTESTEVTSDPYVADTDVDGLSDGTEFQLRSNPRSRDTDGDGLEDDPEFNLWFSNQNSQDSDADGISDGLEITFFDTNPIDEDTDGDGFVDGDELFTRNRPPRVSDLPIPSVEVGSIDLQLDTRFSFTNEQGQQTSKEESSSSTLSQSEERKFSNSDSSTTQEAHEVSNSTTVEVGGEVGVGQDGGLGSVGFSAKASTKLTNQFGYKYNFGNSHTSSFSRDSANSTARAYEASLSTSETIDRRESVTRDVVGALIQSSVLLRNLSNNAFTLSDIELSVLTEDRFNPGLFTPVATLLPASPGLEVDLGTLGGTDERGPFIFTNSTVFPSKVEELLKSPAGLIVNLANYRITDEDGRSFSFAAQDVTDRTAGIVIDFGDGRVESFRAATYSGFDELGKPRGLLLVEILERILGFERDASDGFTTEVRPLKDENVPPNEFEVELLTRVRDQQRVFMDDTTTPFVDEKERFWVVLDGTRRLIGAFQNFSDIRLFAGDEIALAFIQDVDKDLLPAQDEYRYGTSDENVNSDGCSTDDPLTPEVFEGDCARGTYDTMLDSEEVHIGWPVMVVGQPTRQVRPDPALPDSDFDGLADHEERACGTDPRQADTDLDGVTDLAEIDGYRIFDTMGRFVANVPRYDGEAILDGGNGSCETAAVGDDDRSGCDASGQGRVLITPGQNGVLDSQPGMLGDDFIGHLHTTLPDCKIAEDVSPSFATDPRDPDTDQDGFLDGAEASFGANPNNPLDAANFRDTDRDGLSDRVEIDGFETIINGTPTRVFSEPNQPDSDFDGLPDLLERRILSNPQDEDTDDDGLLDSEEFNEKDTCLPTNTCGLCDSQTFKLGFFTNDCNNAPGCASRFRAQDFEADPGTNLNAKDTDCDGLTDREEPVGYLLTVQTPLTTEQRQVKTNPRDADSDDDGLSDGNEATPPVGSLSGPGDATDQDTDDDLFNDRAERSGFGRQLARAEVEVGVRFLNYNNDANCKFALSLAGLTNVDEAEFNFRTGLASAGSLTLAADLTIPIDQYDGGGTIFAIVDPFPNLVVVPVGDSLEHGGTVDFEDNNVDVGTTSFRGFCPRSFNTLFLQLQGGQIDAGCSGFDDAEDEIQNSEATVFDRCVDEDELEVEVRIETQ